MSVVFILSLQCSVPGAKCMEKLMFKWTGDVCVLQHAWPWACCVPSFPLGFKRLIYLQDSAPLPFPHLHASGFDQGHCAQSSLQRCEGDLILLASCRAEQVWMKSRSLLGRNMDAQTHSLSHHPMSLSPPTQRVSVFNHSITSIMQLHKCSSRAKKNVPNTFDK